MSILKSTNNGWIISHQDYIKMKLGKDNIKCDFSTVTNLVQLNRDLFGIHTPFKSTVEVGNSKSRQKRRKLTKLRIPETLKAGIIDQITITESNSAAAELVTLNVDSEIKYKFDCDYDSVTSEIKKISEYIIEEAKNCDVFPLTSSSFKSSASTNYSDSSDNNAKAREAANNFYENMSSFKRFPQFVREIPESIGAKMILFDDTGNFQKFIIPEDSRLYCDDVEHLQHHLGSPPHQFSFLVMDPPWRNKYIRRRKRKQSEAGYQMMTDWDIRKIPVDLITKENALIAVWVTNSKAHQDQVHEFFNSWNVQHLATWYWLKVTTDGIPVCPFNVDTKKQPYESIILGRKKPLVKNCDLKRNEENVGSHIEEISDPISGGLKVIISVPSSIHSHKPPLTEVLRPYIFEPVLNSGNCCEIFARYALPGFTSFGDEVVKLMHEDLYVNIPDTKCEQTK